MLNPERRANQRAQLSIAADFFGHDGTSGKGLGVRASSDLNRSGVVMEFRCCKRSPNSAASIGRSAPNALPHRSPFSQFRSLSVLCRQEQSEKSALGKGWNRRGARIAQAIFV